MLQTMNRVSVSQIITAIENRQVVDVLEHPLHENRRLILVKFKNYIYCMLIEKKLLDYFYILTIFPSEYYTKRYLEGKNENV